MSSERWTQPTGAARDLEVAEAPPPRPWYAPLSDFLQRHLTTLIVIGGVLVFLIIFFAPMIFITIQSGEVGVLYRRFQGGTQTDRVLGEGMKVIAPWNKLFIYNVRVQEAKHSMQALTNEGLAVRLDLSIRYHPEVELVGLLQDRVGPDYVDKIVIPEVESGMRTLVGATALRDVYSMQRTLVQNVINDTAEHVSQKFITIDQIILRDVILPAKVQAEIEEKMTQKQIAESYEYRLEIARQEAARRAIEAEGLQRYNDLLNPSLTPSVLRWQGLEVTRELASSPNAKTIIIGDKTGLPLILGEGAGATIK
jgi:regulator of protease activity HflC (stomatin/prohibitin superfamily)